MLQYTVKRLFISLLTLFFIATATFFLMNLVPGGPFTDEKELPDQIQDSLNEKYGLDKPVHIRFIKYIANLLKGDMGVSVRNGRNISNILWNGFKTSCIIGAIAILIALASGLFWGCISAINKDKPADKIIVFFISIIVSLPNFLTGMLILYVFCIKLEIFNVWQANTINYFLPALCLSIYPSAYITKLTRSGLIDVLNKDYMRTIKAKGAGKLYAVIVHGLKNAIIPVISYLGPLSANVLTGSIVVESIFSTGGMGTLFVSSINTRDYPLIMGTTLFFAFLIIMMNFICDIICKFIDPRIKLT